MNVWIEQWHLTVPDLANADEKLAPGFRSPLSKDPLSAVTGRGSGGQLEPSRSRSSTRRILPEMVLGSSSTNSISRGYLYGALTRLQWSCNSSTSAYEPAWPGARITNALTIWPRSGSGLPTTAASATATCSTRADSTSNGPMR